MPEFFIIRRESKTRWLRKQSLRVVSAMDCAGLWKDMRMLIAKRCRRVTFSGPKPVRMRPRYSS